MQDNKGKEKDKRAKVAIMTPISNSISVSLQIGRYKINSNNLLLTARINFTKQFNQ
jgi:hypothetical protein